VKYEFGVMSCRYSLESKDDLSAKIAMSLFIMNDLPIVIYVPKKEAFLPSKILEENKLKFDKIEVKKAIHSIVKII